MSLCEIFGMVFSCQDEDADKSSDLHQLSLHLWQGTRK